MQDNITPHEQEQDKIHLQSLYKNWFLEYSSYVILERAIPNINDGLKPVQRRILHSMKEIDDGRFHKVANIIGHTMQYHPHGDAAIGDALVNLGQKDLLVETQGNWGDPRTGDRAAAPRYIESRLSKFALDTVFNPGTTEWALSYDGRRKEPITLPVKFPLLLALGVEGIAVGLSTKIMPHNVIELIDASVDVLKNKEVSVYPDFPSGGIADFSNYNGGQKGGKIRVRARIDIVDTKTILIREIPYNTTTSSLIDSILKANDNGKIKIKRVIDNTAQNIEVLVELPSGVSPELTVDALYAFTECEVSISPNCCVIVNEKPEFIDINEVLKVSTSRTVDLLQLELQIQLDALKEKWHFSTLEKIFIENRLYREIEKCETWQAVLVCIREGLTPFVKKLEREISEDDITKLTEIKIKRISKYNSQKADEDLQKLEGEIATIQDHLNNIVQYAIQYFRELKKKYSKGRERKTEIGVFETIQATRVAAANQKLYVDRKNGFIGYSLKKEEFVCECSDIDDIIVFLKSGIFRVTKIADKVFVGKDIIHVAVWKKGDERMVYNVVYKDGESGISFAKRFSVTAVTRDREYDITKGTKGSRVVYFTANPNGETEVISIHLHPSCQARNKLIEFDLAELAIKGRSANGNILTRHPVSRITQKSVGEATFGSMDIWFDEITKRLNTEQRGVLLGSFEGDDLILTITKNGAYQLTSFELTNRYDEKLLYIGKYHPQQVISVVHYDGAKEHHFVKRFQPEAKIGKICKFITDHAKSKVVHVFTEDQPQIRLVYEKKRPQQQVEEIINLNEFIDVKGWKSLGNRLCFYDILGIEKVTSTASETDTESVEANVGEDKNTEEKAPAAPEAKTPVSKSDEKDIESNKDVEKEEQNTFWS